MGAFIPGTLQNQPGHLPETCSLGPRPVSQHGSSPWHVRCQNGQSRRSPVAAASLDTASKAHGAKLGQHKAPSPQTLVGAAAWIKSPEAGGMDSPIKYGDSGVGGRGLHVSRGSLGIGLPFLSCRPKGPALGRGPRTGVGGAARQQLPTPGHFSAPPSSREQLQC